jgi:predicted dehydrogenase
MSTPLGVGLIGYRFMGKAHSHAYRDAGMFFNLTRPLEMRAICGRDEKAVRAAAARWRWQSCETDWRRLLQRADIDIVDIGSPGNTHREIAVAAAKAGKHIICEKPLANSLADAREMLAAAEQAGIKHMVAFNVRKMPAVMLARQWIDQGLIGKPRLFRGVYLQDWLVDPDFPLVWRLQKELCGSGALGDLAAHTIDTAQYLVGWEHSFIHEVYEFAEAIARDTAVTPGFREGVKCQAVLDAVERSAVSRGWAQVAEIDAGGV